MINVDHKGLHIENLNEFNKQHSPSIPKNFPKERLPQDLCQHSLTRMLRCLMGSQANKCGEVNKLYYYCKRERDAQLFRSIQDWEVQEFTQQSDEHFKSSYLQSLQEQRVALIKSFEATPSSIANKHKRWRMAADIEQLQWRLNYLEEAPKPKGSNQVD